MGFFMNNEGRFNTRANGALSKINPTTRVPCPSYAGEGVGRDWLSTLKSVFADIFGDLNAESNNPLVVIGFLAIGLIFYVGM